MYKHTAYIGLGSNLEGPLDQVTRAKHALSRLPQTALAAFSPLYSSQAVGPKQPDYINAVACLQTDLEPLELLDALQGIEQQQKRVRLEHWGPRTIDLDILLFDDLVLDTERLCIPHRWLCERNFVIVPLYDIAPERILPDGRTLRSLRDTCAKTGLSPLNC